MPSQSTPRRSTPLTKRFWASVDKTETCWEWTRPTHGFGYGHIHEGGHAGKLLYAHRVSWEIHFGEIPEGLCVCHHCDNPKCVRPDHLFLGTHGDNVRDKERKGRGNAGDRNGSRRHPERVPRGEQKPNTVLTESLVMELRRQYNSRRGCCMELAKKYGFSRLTVSDAVRGITWKHLPACSPRAEAKEAREK